MRSAASFHWPCSSAMPTRCVATDPVPKRCRPKNAHVSQHRRESQKSQRKTRHINKKERKKKLKRVVTVVVYETGPLELSEGVVDLLLRGRHLPGQDKGMYQFLPSAYVVVRTQLQCVRWRTGARRKSGCQRGHPDEAVATHNYTHTTHTHTHTRQR
jgi:hypothetical protein